MDAVELDINVYTVMDIAAEALVYDCPTGGYRLVEDTPGWAKI